MKDELKELAIKSLKDDLILINAALMLASDSDRAICIRICLRDDNFLDYWIDKNTNIELALNAERILIQNQLDQLIKK